MTFEEFFKKKKIDLGQLKLAEPTLFAEFESHYEQMGEKSFDHTKKYWFNQLRRKFHTADEPKVEKVKIENQVAEQTITESISEPLQAPAASLGFKPKFKTATATPVVPAESSPTLPEDKSEAGNAEQAPAPKLGFKPKFKTAATPSVPVETSPALPEDKSEPENTEQTPAPKLGFKPKFKTTATPSAPTETSPALPKEETEKINTEQTAPKLGFKPKFKATAPKPVEDLAVQPEELQSPEIKEETISEEPEAKPAYKPRFQMKNIKPKTEEGE